MSVEDVKEANARVVYVLGEMGYKICDINKLTIIEIEDIVSGACLVNKDRTNRMKMMRNK